MRLRLFHFSSILAGLNDFFLFFPEKVPAFFAFFLFGATKINFSDSSFQND